MPAYDPTNVFARILRGEIPCHTVFENADTLALMDIMPRSDGHVLVIPKAPARNIFDVAAADLCATYLTVQKVARAATAAMEADGVTILHSNERAGGQVVFHLHVHVMPRWDRIPLRPHTGQMADPEGLKEQAARIRAALEKT